MIKLYNTMTRTVESFQPIDPNNIKIYSCGPTVYDYPHIGNWYAFIHWDLLKRMLTQAGYQSTWVMNITDVGHLVSDADEGEDKIEKGARRDGKTAWDVAKFYTDYFLQSLQKLNFNTPDILPKATDTITEQIAIISQLEKIGLTYQINDGIYFDTSLINDYGKLTGHAMTSLRAGARVSFNPQKRNVTDFALWKFSPKDHKRDMEWPSPWGIGFPSWHIECSAMIKKYLGDTIDIHAGGIDHIQIHHTNEIAISEAITGQPLANYWLHSNHITIKAEKISKSLGNTITIEDITAKGYDLSIFRLWALESHYRNAAEFNWTVLDSAKQRLNNYTAMADLKWQTSRLGKATINDFATTAIIAAVQDDLNSPLALSLLDKKVDIFNKKLLSATDLPNFQAMLETIDLLFGLSLAKRDDINTAQKVIIGQRHQARLQKDYQQADNLRHQLLAEGIILNDTDFGTFWSRTS